MRIFGQFNFCTCKNRIVQKLRNRKRPLFLKARGAEQKSTRVRFLCDRELRNCYRTLSFKETLKLQLQDKNRRRLIFGRDAQILRDVIFAQCNFLYNANFAHWKFCAMQILSNASFAQCDFCAMQILQNAIFKQSNFYAIQFLRNLIFAQ